MITEKRKIQLAQIATDLEYLRDDYISGFTDDAEANERFAKIEEKIERMNLNSQERKWMIGIIVKIIEQLREWQEKIQETRENLIRNAGIAIEDLPGWGEYHHS